MKVEKIKSVKTLGSIGCILVIVIGLAIVSYPPVANYFYEGEAATATVTYDSTIKELENDRRQELIETAKTYNNSLYEYISGKTTEPVEYQEITNFSEILGHLTVERLGMSTMPFYDGDSAEILDNGIGHVPHTSLPVGGNNTHSVITAHSGIKNKVLFTNLNTMKKGDMFSIGILGETLIYQVRTIKTITPEEDSYLLVEENQDKVSLLTCDPPGQNSHRLVVTGYRIKKTPITESTDYSTWYTKISNEKIVTVYLLIFTLLSISYVVVNKRGKRQIPSREGEKVDDKTEVDELRDV